MLFILCWKAEKAGHGGCRKGVISRELEETILNIIISPGIVSVSAHPDYNGGIAHALFYGSDQPQVYRGEASPWRVRLMGCWSTSW